MISFFVPGIARPGGSKTPGVSKSDKRFVRPANKHTKTWMGVVSYHARQHYRGDPLTGAIKVDFIFTMKRPKNHYRANGQLKDWAPLFHTSAPDRTKLMRSTEDALTGIIWKDDSQVCSGNAQKIYGEKPGVEILIQEIAD